LDHGDLRVEPWLAGGDFGQAWCLMNAPLAPNHELEVLHDVGDIDSRPVEPCLGEGPIEHLTGRPDDPRTSLVILITRLLADYHDARVGRTSAEDHLRRVTVELATGAPARRLLERGEICAQRHE